MMRQASIQRTTKETDITLTLCLDGGGVDVSTGIGFFDHMLTALAFYAGFGLELSDLGDLHVDGHHTVEDVGTVRHSASSMGTKAVPYRRMPRLSPRASRNAWPSTMPTSSTVWWPSTWRSPRADSSSPNPA